MQVFSHSWPRLAKGISLLFATGWRIKPHSQAGLRILSYYLTPSIDKLSRKIGSAKRWKREIRLSSRQQLSTTSVCPVCRADSQDQIPRPRGNFRISSMEGFIVQAPSSIGYQLVVLSDKFLNQTGDQSCTLVK